jgi:hypothetical protein
MTDDQISIIARRALADFSVRLDARLITREDDEPYLWRGYLATATGDKEANAFLHRFVSSDGVGELHCHPWSESVSFILLGEYREISSIGEDALQHDVPHAWKILQPPTTRVLRPGDKNVISANTFHRVELLTPEVWTLFIHGPRVQPWGFVKEDVYGRPLEMRVVQGKTSDARPKGVMVPG